MTHEEKVARFGEEIEMVWVLDDEDQPKMRKVALTDCKIMAVPVARYRHDG